MRKIIFLFLISLSFGFSNYCKLSDGQIIESPTSCYSTGAGTDKNKFCPMLVPSNYTNPYSEWSIVSGGCYACLHENSGCKTFKMDKMTNSNETSESNYYDYIKTTEEYKDFVSMAVSTCGAGSNGVHAYLGDTYKYADGIIEHTDCSSSQIEKYTIDYMKVVSSGGFKSYDGTEQTKQENFLKSIITEPDSVTGNFTMPINNSCESKKCRVTSAEDVALPPLQSGCVANQDQTKMFCVNTADEINRVNDSQGDKIIIDNQNQNIYTETDNKQVIEEKAQTSDFQTVNNFGGNNGSTGSENGCSSDTGTSGGSSGGTDGTSDTGDSSDGSDTTDRDIENPYDDGNTQTMEESIADFQTQLYNGNNIVSALGGLSFADRGGSCDPITIDVPIFNKPLSTDLHCRLMTNTNFSTNMRTVFIFGWIIMGLFLIFKL